MPAICRIRNTGAGSTCRAAASPTSAGRNISVASARADQSNPRRRSYLLTAALKDSNEPVGDGFIQMSRYRNAEVGWGVAPSMWGRGYGTELARLLTAMAVERLGALAVTCKVMAPNLASRRVAEKVGYLPDGTIATFTTNDGRQVTGAPLQGDARPLFRGALLSLGSSPIAPGPSVSYFPR